MQVGPTYGPGLLNPSTPEHGKLDIVRRVGGMGILWVHQ